MIPWLYKWLPITFGCHCRADRSFFWRGRQFPICARCTGELTGMLLFAVTAWFRLPAWYLAAVLMVPMVVDGFVQMKTRYISTNPRRFWTGLLFGYGFAAILVLPLIHAFQLGLRIGTQ